MFFDRFLSRGMTSQRQAALFTSLLCGLLGAPDLAASQPLLIDPSTALYYEAVLASEGDILVRSGSEVGGNLHSNSSLQLKRETLVVGSVSAVGTVGNQGTVEGDLTEGVAPRSLPSIPSGDALRALADRVFENDVTFTNEVIDDVVFVDGSVTIAGSLQGTGAILATGDVLLRHDLTPLDPTTLLSIVTLGNLQMNRDRAFRGALWAAGNLDLRRRITLEGVAIAQGNLLVRKDTRIDFLDLDPAPPVVELVSPADGSVLTASPSEIVAAWSDDLSGIDPSTASIRLDGVERIAEATVDADGLTLPLAEILDAGPHTVEISVRDNSGKEGTGSFSFSVGMVVDTEPPTLQIVSPADGAELSVPPGTLELAFSDAGSGIDPSSLRLFLDTIDLSTACDLTSGTASCLAFNVLRGAHEIVAEIRDQAGNTTTVGAEFTVLQPGGPPVLEILAPEPGTVTRAETVVVTGRVFTTGTIAELTINGVAATVIDGQFELDIPTEEGFFEIAIRAVDGAGGEALEQLRIRVDQTPPELTVEQPIDGSLANVDQVQVRGVAMDDSGLVEVTVQGLSVPVDLVDFETSVSLVDGANPITLVARDLAGNETSRVIHVDFQTPLAVSISEPVDQLQAMSDTVTVLGTVSGSPTEVTVAGLPATLSGGAFSAEVPLVLGSNPIAVVARDANGTVGKAVVTVLRDTLPPRLVFTSPEEGQVVFETTVDVAGLINDLIGTVAPTAEPFSVTVNGLPAAVQGDSFALAGVALQPGANVLTATVTDATGNTNETSVSVILATPSSSRLLRISGSGQTASIGAAVPAPLVAQAVDVTGQPVASVPVIFRVTEGNGRLDTGERQTVVFTGADGLASVGFQVGTRAGRGNQSVEAAAVGFAGVARFLADATPGPVADLVLDTGTQQLGITGQPLPEPLVALAVDAAFNPIPGLSVTFEVIAGGGHLDNGLETFEVVTDARGQAIATWTLGPQEGITNNGVVATLGAADPPPPAGSPSVAFIASSMALGSGPTSIRGVVFDNTDQPVPGVTLSIAGTALTTTTDSEGLFVLEDTPSGTIRLDVEGETASRPGVWPHLEFIFQAIPGRDNQLLRPIYLLPLNTEGLLVSETEGGTLSVDGLAGFELEVAPGSATFPDGSKRGVVSVTAVHSDKVPMIPSFFQQPRLVVTVQPSGTRFDPPARLTLPNIDGHEPGEVIDFFSFDHDLARFVSIGPAQVSEDGTTVRSKPGFGIVEGGWHCGENPSGSGTPNKCPDCKECDPDTDECTILKEICTSCGEDDAGKVCDGKGSCLTGVAILPEICDRVGIETAGPNPIDNSEIPPGLQCDQECLAAMRLDFVRVTHSCDSADFAGATYTESELRLVGGTCPQFIREAIDPMEGNGGTVVKGNTFLSGRGPDVTPGDIKSMCGPPIDFLPGPCTVVFEGEIMLGKCEVETRTITYTLGPTCDDYAVN